VGGKWEMVSKDLTEVFEEHYYLGRDDGKEHRLPVSKLNSRRI
jgi:hypothetical protein